VAIVPFQSFADSSRGGIVERHVQCSRAPCILLSLAAVGCTPRRLSETEINKTSVIICNNIAFKITSQCRQCRVKLAIIFVEMNEI